MMIFNGVQTRVELPNCIILPQGKCSNSGPAQGEPSDYSEDVPKGCTAEELDYLATSQSFELDSLSGDWVVLDFIGGVLQIPVITDWFPNPKNTRDASTREDGARYVLRRNNSELLIDKDGDWHFTHRAGNYIQLKGQEIILKHVAGGLINLNEDGGITVMDASGNIVQLDEDGLTVNNGGVIFSLHPDGLRVNAPGGKINLIGDSLNLIGKKVNVTSGAGAKALCHEVLSSDFAAVARLVGLLATALANNPITGSVVKPILQQPLDPTDPSAGTLESALNLALANSLLYKQQYLTKILSGE